MGGGEGNREMAESVKRGDMAYLLLDMTCCPWLKNEFDAEVELTSARLGWVV